MVTLSGGGIVNVDVNAWMAGHIHGEDGCTGCQDKRPTGTDWQARMDTISAMQPDITKWFNREVRTSALNDTGYSVTRADPGRAHPVAEEQAPLRGPGGGAAPVSAARPVRAVRTVGPAPAR
ncbi:hypothetical protein [Streptomyces sp. NPDC087297]|uniref:hypothetical protein n=1 Tax=Streptomyces sp. NPDC087297 TaxID=3365778 RepID=UPI0037F5A53D